MTLFGDGEIEAAAIRILSVSKNETLLFRRRNLLEAPRFARLKSQRSKER
ncbi:MAG TPA: hypothetical protein VFA98_01070 [Thermoanaerobaculia bacterium]|nr:hypothetical protein [Thermoanaerobaculia bacterium]